MESTGQVWQVLGPVQIQGLSFQDQEDWSLGDR